MDLLFDGSGQRENKEPLEEYDSELLEEDRPSPGKSSRTHGGNDARGIPGKISLTMRLVEQIDQQTKTGHGITSQARGRAAYAGRLAVTGMAAIRPPAGPAVALDRKPGWREPADFVQALMHHVLGKLGSDAGRPLPPELASRMSELIGHDFSHVRVYTDRSAAETAALLGARAFTVGSRIYMGRGEWAPGTEEFERLLAHELTHVAQHDRGELQPGSGGAMRIARRDERTEREAEATAARVGEVAEEAEVSGASEVSQASEASEAAAAPGASEVADARSPGADGRSAPTSASTAEGSVISPLLGISLSDIVRQFSPELATLIDQGPMGMVREALEEALASFMSPITGLLDGAAGVFGDLTSSFDSALQFIQGLFAGDAGCCDAFIEGIDRIRNLAQSVAENPIVQAVQSGLGQITEAIQQVATVVLAPVFDVIKDSLGGAWDAITGMVDTITGWLQPVIDFSRDAANWAMEQLGISGGEGGILSWLTEAANEVWSSLTETLGPVAGPLQTVGTVLVAVSPMGPILALIEYGPQLVEAVQWLWANRNNPDIVKQSHEQMGHTFLPGLLDAAQGFGEAMQGAATWMVEQATSLGSGLLELVGAITGVPLLSMVSSAVQTLSDAATQLSQWASTVLSSAVTELQSGFEALAAFIEPYKEVLCSIGMAIANPAMIPVIIAGHAWQALPDCIKGPIIDLLLDAAIAVLETTPSLVMFGPLWAILKSGVIGFLRGLRAQPNEVKEQVSNKIARILSGGSPEFLLGFVKGFLTGVWEGLTDPFVLIWTAVQGLGSLISWLSGLAQQALGGGEQPAAAGAGNQASGNNASGLPTRAELGERASQMAGELEPPVGQVTSGFMPAVQEFFQGGEGMTLEQLIAKLGEAWAAMDAAIQGAGASMANKVCEFFMGDEAEGKLGEGVGWLAGTIAFEVLLTILTAGAWQPVSAAGRALQAFARILDWTGEAMGMAFRALSRVGSTLMDALQGLRRMLANAGGAASQVLDALGEIGQKIVAFADELMGRFGRGVADDAAQEVGEEVVEEAGEEIAEEAAEQVGEEVAEEAGEETAEQVAEEAGEETAEQAGEEVAEEATEQTGEEVAEEAAEQTGEEASEQAASEAAERADEIAAKADEALATPPPLQQQIDRVTGVDKGPEYEAAQEQLRRFYENMELEAQNVVHVNGVRTEGPYGWNYGHDVQVFSHGLTNVRYRVYLDGSTNGISPADLERLKANIVRGIDDHYNFRHTLPDASGQGGTRLHFEIEFVNTPGNAHLDVTVHPGDGRADLANWYVDGNPTTHAHEVGHGAFGFVDEYVDPAVPNRATPTSPGVSYDDSLMGNYWRQAPDGTIHPDPNTGMRPRHLDEIADIHTQNGAVRPQPPPDATPAPSPRPNGSQPDATATPSTRPDGSQPDATATPSTRPGSDQPVGNAPAMPARTNDEIAQSLQSRIDNNPGFQLTYTPDEVQGLIARGRQLGLTDKEIEDLLFAGSRTSKPISADELAQQMDNYANTVRARGYPYQFDSLEDFETFKSQLRSSLEGLGLPTNNVRFQGSAMRKPTAKDIDLAVFIDEADFDRTLAQIFAGKVKRQGVDIDIRSMSPDELARLADEIHADDVSRARTYNALARTFSNALRSRKIRPQDVPGLNAAKKQLERDWCEIDLSIMTPGSEFDLDPSMRL